MKNPIPAGGADDDEAHQYLCPASPSFLQNTAFCFHFVPLVSHQEILLAQEHTQVPENLSYLLLGSFHTSHTQTEQKQQQVL